MWDQGLPSCAHSWRRTSPAVGLQVTQCRASPSTYIPRRAVAPWSLPHSSVRPRELSEARFDTEKEVHHVCFGTYQAKITRATSSQAPEVGAAGHARVVAPSGHPPAGEGRHRESGHGSEPGQCHPPHTGGEAGVGSPGGGSMSKMPSQARLTLNQGGVQSSQWIKQTCLSAP